MLKKMLLRGTVAEQLSEKLSMMAPALLWRTIPSTSVLSWPDNA